MKIVKKTDNGEHGYGREFGAVCYLSNRELEKIIGEKEPIIEGKEYSINVIHEAVKNIDSILYLKKNMLRDIEELKTRINGVFFPLKEKE